MTLESTQPIRSLLSLMQLFGIWKFHLNSTRRKILLVTLFALFYSSAIVFMLLSIYQDNSIIAIAKVIAFELIVISAIGYIIPFWIFNEDYVVLMSDLSREFDKNVILRRILRETCELLSKGEVRKWALLGICFICGIFGPLFTRSLLLPWYTMPGMETSSIYYYVMLTIQSVILVYVPMLMSAIQNMIFCFATLISKYGEHLCTELEELDLCGKEGRKDLIECIKLHQNIQRYVRTRLVLMQYCS
jgi:hypothetical protein